ncbi:hypothetical protein SBA3_1920022 [Candidatus Sulfopaludibacter sp. SbA3]|nr:hypothetical protein SBA3_1920022 [Candidatus Sulfopaludibacter sp. SbA3]
MSFCWVRRVEAERQDELLLESVGARISQVVPEALEPLRQQEGGRQ